MEKIRVVEYLQDGQSVFEKWFNSLDAHASAKVTTALYRLEQGNLSNVRSIGKGVWNIKSILAQGTGFILVRMEAL